MWFCLCILILCNKTILLWTHCICAYKVLILLPSPTVGFTPDPSVQICKPSYTFTSFAALQELEKFSYKGTALHLTFVLYLYCTCICLLLDVLDIMNLFFMNSGSTHFTITMFNLPHPNAFFVLLRHKLSSAIECDYLQSKSWNRHFKMQTVPNPSVHIPLGYSSCYEKKFK